MCDSVRAWIASTWHIDDKRVFQPEQLSVTAQHSDRGKLTYAVLQSGVQVAFQNEVGAVASVEKLENEEELLEK
jgi:hypothetical protein